MKKLRILKGVLVRTHADRLLMGYLVYVLLTALFILWVEPNITGYGDALWYCYAVLSTAGFGDIVATTLLGKIASVLLTAYSLIALAIITGVIVNFYTQVIQLEQKETLAAMADELEHLPELSTEELEQLSARIRRFRSTLKS